MFASNGLARVWIGEQKKKMKGTTKPLMANLDITHVGSVPETNTGHRHKGLALSPGSPCLQFCKQQAISKGISDQNLGAGKAGDAPM